MVENIQWVDVVSSNIEKVSYKQASKRLFVQFRNRKSEDEYYIYKEVDPVTFNNFMNAESKGKFLHSEIRSQFKVEKVVDGSLL